MNLFIPMKPRPDLKNNIKPMLVFRASKFTPSELWNEAERVQWDPRVHVCFQENAWVDTPTNVYIIEKASECVETWLEQEDLEAITFEDNLGWSYTNIL